MKATATKDFSATLGGRAISCKAGDDVEADKRTIARLVKMGLAEQQQAKRTRKAARND